MQMEVNNNEPMEEDRKKRQVGEYIRVPIFDLNDGIEVAKTISEIGGGKLDIESIAESMGYSKSYVMHHINSAKHHLLVENDDDNKNKIKITNLGTSILHPKSEVEYSESVIKSFLSCKLYNEIYNRYKGKDLLSLDILANIFSRDVGVSFKTKDRTVLNFIQSGITAGLIKKYNGVYHCLESIENEIENKTQNVKKVESIDSDLKFGDELEELDVFTDKNKNLTQKSLDSDKIRISAEPFFELYINPDVKSFDALLQLLPFYKEVYLNKNDDSLQR